MKRFIQFNVRKPVQYFKIIYSLLYFGQARRSKDGALVENQEASRITCGGKINEDSIITSPGFDDPDRGYYYNNLNCTWDISIPGASGLKITPEIFEVETSSGENFTFGPCHYDFLSVIWADDQERDYSYKFCSVDLPPYLRVQNPLKRRTDAAIIFLNLELYDIFDCFIHKKDLGLEKNTVNLFARY